MDQDAPPPAAIRDLLTAAGCKREFIQVMHTITFSLCGQGESPEAIIARWQAIKPTWFHA